MSDESIAVFTSKDPEYILSVGGSDSWKLDPKRARKCLYLICVRNDDKSNRNFTKVPAEHRTVFMVGKISDVIPDDDRWRICISEYAEYKVLNAQKGWRNPVRYTTLEEMGINLNELTFRSVADGQRDLEKTTGQQIPVVAPRMQDDRSAVQPLSIASAKAGLAAYYGVSQDAIEIVIRG